jgi:hypothetical protein
VIACKPGDTKAMNSWSYKIVTVPNNNSVEEQLNRDGKDGWEAFQLQFHSYDGSTVIYYKKGKADGGGANL